MDLNDEQLRWGVRRRLEFIDFRLFWDGRFNRSDMIETFGISAQQTSADIGLYARLASDNLVYSSTEKAFVRTDQFKPIFIGETIDWYLVQLVSIRNNWLRSEDTWFASFPNVEVATLGNTATNPTVLLHILSAIRNRHKVDVNYDSMTGSSEHARTIAPHSLVQSSGYWYVRSWSSTHNDFRDYKLNRISSVGKARPSQIDPTLDYEWALEINLRIVPNPGLAPERQIAIAKERGMSNKQLVRSCRLSLVFYLMSEYNLDVEHGILNPEKQQIVLQNLEEVRSARAAARQMSKEALLRAQSSED